MPAFSVRKQVCKMKLSTLSHFQWIKVSTFALHLPSFRCSIFSLSLFGQGGQLLLSSRNLYLNRRCVKHSTLHSLVSLLHLHIETHARTFQAARLAANTLRCRRLAEKELCKLYVTRSNSFFNREMKSLTPFYWHSGPTLAIPEISPLFGSPR